MRRRQALELSISFEKLPWVPFDRISAHQQTGATGRDISLALYNRWARFLSPIDFIVYSDGSLDENGIVGAGYCVYQGSQEIMYEKIPLGRNAQVYDTEVIGPVAGLRSACLHWMARLLGMYIFVSITKR